MEHIYGSVYCYWRNTKNSIYLLLFPVQTAPGWQLAGQLVYSEGCRLLTLQRVSEAGGYFFAKWHILARWIFLFVKQWLTIATYFFRLTTAHLSPWLTCWSIYEYIFRFRGDIRNEISFFLRCQCFPKYICSDYPLKSYQLSWYISSINNFAKYLCEMVTISENTSA